MDHRIAEMRAELESIAERLTEVSVDILREAVEAGESNRPEIDKHLSTARRAVEKAARALEDPLES